MPKIFMNCGEIHSRFHPFIVQTTHKEVMELMNQYKNEYCLVAQKHMYKKLYHLLTQYDDEKMKFIYHHREDNKYTDWCLDVLHWYVLRYILFDQHIPIIEICCRYCQKPQEKENKFKKCSRCKLSYYCSKECQINHWSRHQTFCVEQLK